EAGRAARCYVQPVSGGAPRPVTPEGTSFGLLSPDAKTLLVRLSAGGLELFPMGGGAGRPVRGASPEDFVIQWSADGRSIVVQKPSEIPARIESLDLETGQRKLIRTVGPARLAGALQISRLVMNEDGKYYAYATRVMFSRLFIVEGAR